MQMFQDPVTLDSDNNKVTRLFLSHVSKNKKEAFISGENHIWLFLLLTLLSANNNESQFIEYLEYGVTVIFCAEMCLKVIDQGLVIHPGSYLRNPWNILGEYWVPAILSENYL